MIYLGYDYLLGHIAQGWVERLNICFWSPIDLFGPFVVYCSEILMHHSSNGAFLTHLKQKLNKNIENEHNMGKKSELTGSNTGWLYTSLAKSY